jgi:hypothetical protein
MKSCAMVVSFVHHSCFRHASKWHSYLLGHIKECSVGDNDDVVASILPTCFVFCSRMEPSSFLIGNTLTKIRAIRCAYILICFSFSHFSVHILSSLFHQNIVHPRQCVPLFDISLHLARVSMLVEKTKYICDTKREI